MDALNSDKGAALLRFLKDAATLRRKRVPSYGPGDRVVWFADIPKGRPECRSAFLAATPGEIPDLWLEVRKKRMPARPPVPNVTADWVRPEYLEQIDREPELLPEITVLVEQVRAPQTTEPSDESNRGPEKIPELRRLKDYPEVQDAWIEYLVDQWEPWSKEKRLWQELQRVYEDVDFMRRRLEESEERYELLLSFGLLHWRDSTGTTIKRHILTGPAEIALDAARGILTAGPAAAFQSFRMELDMLEAHDQPSNNLTAPSNGPRIDQIGLGTSPGRLLFPLPTNDEQRQIANRLESSPHVLVKGPPGTGKSWTIANLICHLLASGERILITAHAPKALSVLRGLLPDDLRALCVMALGSSREDQHLLEEGVRGILARQNDWRGDDWARSRIDEIERELQQLQNELAQTERRLPSS